MPVAALKNLAKQAKISETRAEELWDKAKGIAKTEYNLDAESSWSEREWSLVMGITKRMMGLEEASVKPLPLRELARLAERRINKAP